MWRQCLCTPHSVADPVGLRFSAGRRGVWLHHLREAPVWRYGRLRRQPWREWRNHTGRHDHGWVRNQGYFHSALRPRSREWWFLTNLRHKGTVMCYRHHFHGEWIFQEVLFCDECTNIESPYSQNFNNNRYFRIIEKHSISMQKKKF